MGARRMSLQLEFMHEVEPRQTRARPAFFEEAAETMIGENPLEEVLAAGNVVQARLLLDRQQRPSPCQRRGEKSASAARITAAEDCDIFQTTTWRVLLQYVATQFETRQGLKP